MLTRQAVLLTTSKSTHSRRLLFYKIKLSITHLESTLLQVFILRNFILFRMNTKKNPPGGWGLMVNQLFPRSNLCGSPPAPSAAHPLACPDTVRDTSHDSLAGRIRAAAVHEGPYVCSRQDSSLHSDSHRVGLHGQDRRPRRPLLRSATRPLTHPLRHRQGHPAARADPRLRHPQKSLCARERGSRQAFGGKSFADYAGRR